MEVRKGSGWLGGARTLCVGRLWFLSCVLWSGVCGLGGWHCLGGRCGRRGLDGGFWGEGLDGEGSGDLVVMRRGVLLLSCDVVYKGADITEVGEVLKL